MELTQEEFNLLCRCACDVHCLALEAITASTFDRADAESLITKRLAYWKNGDEPFDAHLYVTMRGLQVISDEMCNGRMETGDHTQRGLRHA